MDGLRVSVLVPAFNAEPTIRESLASVLHQSLPAAEIVVVDDGSSDRTPAILAELAAAEPRLRILTQPNRGIVAALNAGLAECRGELIARHDADDLADPDRLCRQVDYLARHPGCVAVSGASRLIDAQSRPLVVDGAPAVHVPAAPDDADPAWVPAREPYLPHPFALFRAAALRRVGFYRHVVNSEDSDLYWRLAEIGRLANLPAILGSYRLHAASISGSSLANGRIMAVQSQLAALSARRRAAGRLDLAFPPGRRVALPAAPGLAAVIERSAAGLEPAELRHLRVASVAKLLELAGYRPYELELEDCRFARAALADLPDLPSGNRTLLDRQVAASGARLLRAGRVGEATALLPPRLWPEALTRAIANRLFWRRLVPPPAQRSTTS